VADDEVEYWIVRAIGSKLLEAKMDQLRQVVVIRY
jgi:translation initiation factor 3 subunit M